MPIVAAVVDTNVLVSGLLRPSGPPGAVVQAALQGQLVPVVCPEVMSEYQDVLLRPRFGFVPQDVDELLLLIEQQALWVDIGTYPEQLALPDPEDWPFVASALAARCPVITGNAKHFPKRLGLDVLSARQWMDTEA
jgi:putative PIN family toxin of toxin-antitoxin system